MKTMISAVAIALAAGSANAAMTLTSADIQNNAAIGSAHVYTQCGGKNTSPQLSWTGVPANAKGLVLTVIDPDAKPSGWSHWLIVNLPAKDGELARDTKVFPEPGTQVANDFAHASYDGPCPPKGSGVHHYVFTLWALPTATYSLPPNTKANAISPALEKVALEKAMLTGTFQR